MQIENLILNVLVKDPEFAKKVRPHLTPEYFQADSDRLVYSLIEDFYSKYSQKPPKDSLIIDLDNRDGVSESAHEEAQATIRNLFSEDYEYAPEWLLKQSEKFCRDRAIYNAIMKSVKIINGESGSQSEGAIPAMLSKALSVGFDIHVGHDYFGDAVSRYEFYHKTEKRFKTRLTILNKVTGGGLPSKTLCLLLAQTGGGKSAVKCSLAADWLRDGYDVLYITMELAEERIAERIDANLLNIPISEVKTLSEDVFTKRMEALKQKAYGNLVIKEYPTGSASVDNFNALLEELQTKRGFKPQIVIIDYLQICSSSTHKANSSMNTYQMQKYVAEEFRGFAVSHDVLVLSSIQTNRSGFNSSDFDESSISDSAAILFTADFVLGIIRPEELKEKKQVMFKQIKSRFGDPTYYQKFICNLDTNRMKVYDLEEISQPTSANKPQFDKKPEKPAWESKSWAVPSAPPGSSLATDDWDFE